FVFVKGGLFTGFDSVSQSGRASPEGGQAGQPRRCHRGGYLSALPQQFLTRRLIFITRFKRFAPAAPNLAEANV
ncbi:MAG: hypothetical protein WBN03_10915, partial [Desulfobacterales bacterium]